MYCENDLTIAVIDLLPCAAVVADTDGKIVFANSKLTSWFGYAADELPGRPTDLVFPVTIAAAPQDDRCRPGGSWIDEVDGDVFRCGARAKDGSAIPVQIHIQRMETNRGSLILLIVAAISPHQNLVCKADDLDLWDLLWSRQIQSQRIDAIDQTVRGLSHATHNALQRARAAIDLLELDFDPDSEQANLLNRIRLALTDVWGNFDRVRSYSAPLYLRFESIDLIALCREVFSQVTRTVSSGKQLSLNGHGIDPTIRADEARVRILLEHLILNSLAATDQGISVAIELSDRQYRGERAIEMAIRDCSGGLKAACTDQLFEPFYTTKQQGLGLGLAICKRIVDAHDGEIVASDNNDGIAISLTLPRRN
ncbi:MAG: PAS domain S-box protein [Pirellulaceae bacterium]|nr:PAS domain S-box protein [Pirellulaceae bacterium]